jgi:hypothetical protein
MGVRPTHLDSHQYRPIMSGKELFEAMPRVAHDYKLPMFVTRDWFADYPYLQESLERHRAGPHGTIGPEVAPGKWAEF